MTSPKETPTLTPAQKTAADLLAPHEGGGNKRQADLQKLDSVLKAKAEANEYLRAIVAEASGAGKAELESRQAAIAEAEAEEAAMLDRLATERASLRKALDDGLQATKELGSTRASADFLGSPQGRELAARLSSIDRALLRLGAQDREPPEPVAKAVAARAPSRSDACREFIAKRAEIARSLRITEREAAEVLDQRQPELRQAAMAAPITIPGPVPSASTAVSKSASDPLAAMLAETRHRANALQLKNAFWPGVSASDARVSIAKAASTMTLAEILEAVLLLTEDQRAQVLAALDDPKTLADVQARAAALTAGATTTAKFKPCASNPDAMCRDRS